jgi:hypothetical protein
MIQILVYADSLTWGIIPSTRQRLPFAARWPGVLEAELSQAGYSVRVIEDCLNGRRTVWDDPYKPGRGSQWPPGHSGGASRTFYKWPVQSKLGRRIIPVANVCHVCPGKRHWHADFDGTLTFPGWYDAHVDSFAGFAPPTTTPARCTILITLGGGTVA